MPAAPHSTATSHWLAVWPLHKLDHLQLLSPLPGFCVEATHAVDDDGAVVLQSEVVLDDEVGLLSQEAPGLVAQDETTVCCEVYTLAPSMALQPQESQQHG